MGLLVEPLETTDGFKVSGRGELHLSILLENMRREGYEVAVSKPEVIMHRDEKGKLLEPIEKVVISVPDEYSGPVISKLNIRKGIMTSMSGKDGYSKLEYLVPTRGLLGYRTEFINDTRGEGTFVRRFECFEHYKGEIPQRTNGAVIAQEEGVATPYALDNIGERAMLFIEPGTKVYEGMIDRFEFCFITDFPMYEINEETGKIDRIGLPAPASCGKRGRAAARGVAGLSGHPAGARPCHLRPRGAADGGPRSHSGGVA